MDRQNPDKSPEDRLYDGMMFYKRLSEAEGTPTPELDAMLSGDPRHITMPPVNDPLEGAGGRYARLSSAYLASRDDLPFEMIRHPNGPTPFEAFAWYHFLIAVKISRAVTSSAAAARGDEAKRTDALVSAKVALIGIDRSLDALASMTVEDDDPRLELMAGQLRRLKREMEARFPDARAVVREGLD